MKVEHRAVAAAEVQEAKPVDRAKVKPVQPAPVKPAGEVAKALTIMVNADGSFEVAGKKLTEAQLIKNLKAEAQVNPKRRVLITADALTPHQVVVGAMKHCKAAGLTNISFATKP